MKKIFLILVFTFIGAVFFTSCDKDDNEPEKDLYLLVQEDVQEYNKSTNSNYRAEYTYSNVNLLIGVEYYEAGNSDPVAWDAYLYNQSSLKLQTITSYQVGNAEPTSTIVFTFTGDNITKAVRTYQTESGCSYDSASDTYNFTYNSDGTVSGMTSVKDDCTDDEDSPGKIENVVYSGGKLVSCDAEVEPGTMYNLSFDMDDYDNPYFVNGIFNDVFVLLLRNNAEKIYFTIDPTEVLEENSYTYDSNGNVIKIDAKHNGTIYKTTTLTYEKAE